MERDAAEAMLNEHGLSIHGLPGWNGQTREGQMRTKAEEEFIGWFQAYLGRELTAEEIWLAMEQARAAGELDGPLQMSGSV